MNYICGYRKAVADAGAGGSGDGGVDLLQTAMNEALSSPSKRSAF